MTTPAETSECQELVLQLLGVFHKLDAPTVWLININLFASCVGVEPADVKLDVAAGGARAARWPAFARNAEGIWLATRDDLFAWYTSNFQPVCPCDELELEIYAPPAAAAGLPARYGAHP
ncbi:MAG TPA: hypothetical protein VNJ70_17950 [Thermoanaerobaculia bacterium]|nr:hypothetical protein [Thermoanaerobaculia bacterium]